MISRAANRTSSERSSSTSLRPAISALSFSRVRSDAGILSIGVLLCGGRSPNRTSLVRLIRRRCTPTLFPASLGLHPGSPHPRNTAADRLCQIGSRTTDGPELGSDLLLDRRNRESRQRCFG